MSHHAGSYLTLLQDFLHCAQILLFDLLTRHFGIPLARSDLAMPQEVPNGDNLGPVFEEVRGKGLPQAMATRREPCGLGVALYLLLNRFHREGVLGAFTVPKDIALRPRPWMLLETLLDTRHGIGRHVHAPIFAPFALHDMDGLLLPIDLLQLELCHLGDPEATAEDHEKQRTIHRMGDLAKEPLDLLTGEGFGQGAPAPDKVTGLDGIPSHQLLLHAKGKKVLQRIEPPVDRRPGSAVVMLAFDKLVDLTKGHLRKGHGHLGKEQAQIKGIIRDGMGGELAALQVRPKPVDGGLADVIQGLPPV
jgi:hypothetical protein